MIVCVAMLVACGKEKKSRVATDAEIEELIGHKIGEHTQSDNGKEVYTVKVVNKKGKAISNAVVQANKGNAYYTVMTNKEGVAEFDYTSEGYEVSILSSPDGQSSRGETYHLSSNNKSVTITLK